MAHHILGVDPLQDDGWPEVGVIEHLLQLQREGGLQLRGAVQVSRPARRGEGQRREATRGGAPRSKTVRTVGCGEHARTRRVYLLRTRMRT